MSITISIIVPVYNEEKTIAQVIRRLKEAISNTNYKYEIIVINDGSTDMTSKILSNIKDIKIIHNNLNRGYGSSIKTGIESAKEEYILMIDADGTYPIEPIPKLLSYLEKYDMVIGARIGKHVKIPFLRKPAKWILYKIANFVSKKKIPDLNSGLRAFNKEKCLEFWKLYPERFSFTTTITMAFLSKGYKVKYLPINYFRRKGKSSVSAFDFYNFCSLLLKLTLLFNPIKIFTSISLFLFLTAIGVAFYSIYFLGRFMDVTVTLLVLSSLQILLFGLIAHVIIKYK